MKSAFAGAIVLHATLLSVADGLAMMPSSPPGKPAAVSPPLLQSRRLALSTLLVSAGASLATATLAPNSALAATDTDANANVNVNANNKPRGRNYQRYPSIRFIAALGDPDSSSGTGAETWGLWRDDPGPRGVYLKDYDRRIGANDDLMAPAGWKFDPSDWWVEEHGLIMSTPEPLPRKSLDRDTREVLPEKSYIVTGDREVTTVMTVRENGTWELEKGCLYDVTHLPCRSAAYRGGTCAPKNANLRDFPVRPGAEMPKIEGCDKQDYAVLFVLGEVV